MRKKYNPTDEQKAKAQARREDFRKLARLVSEMTDEQRLAMLSSIGAVPTCAGRALSPFNSCLLLHQLPAASLVGGFNQWNKVGRSVRKGEHGLMIWIPCAQKVQQETPVAGDLTEDKLRFVLGTVFDVSQTDEIASHPQ